jgi:hypothetical protein
METQKIEIKKGLDLPITGQPKQEIDEGRRPGKVAVVGTDYVGMKPKFAVSIGDSVKLGELLFTDKKMPLKAVMRLLLIPIQSMNYHPLTGKKLLIYFLNPDCGLLSDPDPSARLPIPMQCHILSSFPRWIQIPSLRQLQRYLQAMKDSSGMV